MAILIFARLKVQKKYALPRKSFGFSIGSTLGVKYDLILALRSQIFEYLRETFFRQALVYLQSARSDKNKCFSYGNAWPVLTFLKACGRWGHVFDTSASPTPRTRKLAMSPFFIVHGGRPV